MDPAMLAMAPMVGAILAAAAAPFVQEDAAVIGSAALAVADPPHAHIWLTACLVGLIASDLWKYGLGALAHRSAALARFAAKPKVAAARDAVVRRLGAALIAARFVPGTRVPLYLAAGYARAPFVKFATFVTLSGAAYVSLAYVVARTVGSEAFAPLRAPAALIVGVVAVALVGAHMLRRRPV